MKLLAKPSDIIHLMSSPASLYGIFAAAVTPLKADLSPDLEALPALLDFLAGRGCHGVLLLGTTGEGPSFAINERLAILRAAAEYKRSRSALRLLLGTGTPSLEETIQLNRAAFDQGLDGVVTLPPYYFRKVSDEGLFAWFSQVLEKSVPQGGALLGYHFPSVSGVPLSLDLLARLLDAHPTRFAGIKDSSGDPDFARQLGERFGRDLVVFNGNDKNCSLALNNQAAGAMTAMANLFSPGLRQVWEAHQQGQPDQPAQDLLNARRAIVEQYPPFPPLMKALLHARHGFPLWPVRPALLATPVPQVKQALEELAHLD